MSAVTWPSFEAFVLEDWNRRKDTGHGCKKCCHLSHRAAKFNDSAKPWIMFNDNIYLSPIQKQYPDTDMYNMSPQFPNPDHLHCPFQRKSSILGGRKHGGGGLVWISMDMSLDLWRNGWQNIDSPGPGVCWYKHTHTQTHTAIWTDRQAAASLMGRLMEMIHAWINTQDMME